MLKIVRMKSIKKIEARDKYDLEIKDNNNFFANKMLVHNCRCIVTKDGMFSRYGKVFVSSPHIFETLKPLFHKDPNLIFDGELYCNKYAQDFNKIISLVKQSKPTEEDIELSKKSIQYWIYDLPSIEDVFSKRNEKLLEIFDVLKKDGKLDPNNHIVYVETQQPKNPEELDKYYYQWIEDGYEGEIVRLNGLYANKRTKALLKRKQWITEEFELISIEEGEGGRAGMAGAAWVKVNNTEGKCKVNIKGNRYFMRSLLRDKDKLVGQMATVKYFNITPDGSLRFAHLLTMRDYE